MNQTAYQTTCTSFSMPTWPFERAVHLVFMMWFSGMWDKNVYGNCMTVLNYLVNIYHHAIVLLLLSDYGPSETRYPVRLPDTEWMDLCHLWNRWVTRWNSLQGPLPTDSETVLQMTHMLWDSGLIDLSGGLRVLIMKTTCFKQSFTPMEMQFSPTGMVL